MSDKLAAVTPSALPKSVSFDEDPGYLRWRTPAGHTVLMPFKDETIEHHQRRLGPDARSYMQSAAQRVSADTDKQIAEEQASFFNQHPHVRQALAGGAFGGLSGALVGAHLHPRHLGRSALVGAGLGALLAQFGDTTIRKGPETRRFELGHDTLPSAFYHESPRELAERQHREVVEKHQRYQRHRDFYDDLDRGRPFYQMPALTYKYSEDAGAWQRSEGKNPEGGLNAKGRASLKAQGHDIKPGVKGEADTPDKQRRKGSFLSRMFGPGAPGSMKEDSGKPSRRALSAAAWGEPVPKDDSGRARLYAKGQALLRKYKNRKTAEERAVKEVLARYKLSDMKQADIDKLIRGHVTAIENTDHQTPAEEASIEDRLSRVFRAADSKGPAAGTESSQGALPAAGVADV